MRKPTRTRPTRVRSSQLTRRRLAAARGGLALVPADEIPILIEESVLAVVRGGVFEPNNEPTWKRTDVRDAHD